MSEKKYKIGYTQGAFDLFHIGHLNLLKQAKEQCEVLIVGVNSNILVQEYKKKHPVIDEHERAQIIDAIKYVDKTIICDTLDKVEVCLRNHIEAVFIGSDWKGHPRWIQTEKDLNAIGIDVVFLNHTDGVSSSKIRDKYVAQ